MRKCQPLCIAAAAVVTVISLHLDAPASAEDWDAAKAKAQCASFTTYGMAEEGV